MTVSEEDAQRAREIIGGLVPVDTLGDSRFDRVIMRASSQKEIPRGIVDACCGRRVLVLGSSHADDEELVLPTIRKLRAQVPNLLAIIVPHDPSARARRRVAAQCLQYGLVMHDLDNPNKDSSPDVLLVNRTGMLADLYRVGHVAYVGGGFGKGVHSVLEPMACGLPVLCGPRVSVSNEARVASREGILSVTEGRKSFEETAAAWLGDERVLADLSARVRAFVETRGGVSAKIVARLNEALGE